MTKRAQRIWQRFLQASLWIASIGLMVASSGLDGAYLARLMPAGWAWLGLLLNTMADITSELGMYWYGRLQMDRSKRKQANSRWVLVGQVVLVGYAWLFGWRQLVPKVAEIDPGAPWMAPIGAAFIPAALIVVGYIQSLLAGRIEAERVSAEPAATGADTAQSEPEPPPVERQPAKMADFRRVLGRMNGDRAALDAERLAAELAKDDLILPSDTTVRRWLKVAHK